MDMAKPIIRFKGYQDDWEQRKFSEFVENVAVKNREGLDLECYAVTNDRGFISQKEAHDDFGYMADVDTKAYNIVPPNSFAYNPARINVGSIGYYTGTENVIVSSLYEVFQTADYVDDRFLWHWFKSEHFPKWIERLQEGSVRLYFYYDKLIQCEMKMPSLGEQKKIGAYFDSLDHLITLHQRKCDETKRLKKYMLQKMFPQNGKKVPEIRFSGFTDDWEQRKLGDICKMNGRIGFRGYTEKDIITKEAGGILTFSPTNIVDNQLTIGVKNTYITREKYNESPEIMVQKGNILFVKTGSTLGKSALVTGIEEDCTVNPQVVVIKVESNLQKILSVVLTSSPVQKQIAAVKIGGAVPTMTETELKNIDLALPQNVNERIKIGEYFENFDNLITLHQRELENLQNIKKFMLEKMFV